MTSKKTALPAIPDSPEELAAARLAAVISPEAIDRLLADAQTSGIGIDGVDGLLNQMTKAVLERVLQTEMADHLGYEKGDPSAVAIPNSRNGYSAKTIATTNGSVRIQIPRDRNGEFEPQIVPKRARRLGQIEDMILSLYARGMTTRDITAHLGEVYGMDVSAALVSSVTDVVAEEITTWQNRPLDPIYPIVYIDAIVIKVRDNGSVTNKAAYIVIGVDTDGVKDVLGIWLQDTEGAKFWLHVLTQLKNRGVADVLIVCCDGLTGLPEAIVTVWPDAIVQTCVVHLIRNSMKFVSYTDRKAVAKALKTIYTATSSEAAQQELNTVEKQWGSRYPGMIDVWRRQWEEFIPFLEFPVEIRRVIYTTNAIESLNFGLRKITKNRGHFPTDDAAIKLLYLGIRNITGRHIDGPAGSGRGTGTMGWIRALNYFALHFPGRLILS